MRSWKKTRFSFIRLVLFILSVGLSSLAVADTLRAQKAESRLIENQFKLNASFAITLTNAMDEALHQGVPLYFTVEFEIARPKWLKVYRGLFVSGAQTQYRLSYHALTRQYRLSSGSLYQSFSSLRSALRMLGTIRQWRVLERDAQLKELSSGRKPALYGQIRMRFDATSLPRPFQLGAFGSRDWVLESEWLEFPMGEVEGE